ncbi:MAG: endonuclease III [Lentisphaerae bacterium]|nr:endonuclease III [Lentisphaerota bacterium]
MTPAEREAVFARLAERIVPRTELSWETPLDLLVAVVLSAQSTDRAVNRITARLWESCRTPSDYLALGEERLAEHFRSIGLFRNKARAVIGICRLLLERHGGAVPSRREDLEALPGVGHKTASVVLNVVFGQPTVAVDTHVFRVAHRLGLARARSPAETEEQLLRVVPAAYRRDAHHYLILHGRYTCTARRPRCPECPLADLCTYRRKTAAPAAAPST